MYLIDISDDYPESYWLEYDSKKFPDPQSLKRGHPVEPTEFLQVYLSANPKASINKILEYDYLFSSGPELVSERLAKILTSSRENSIQLIPTKIKHNTELHNGFYLINYLTLKEALDTKKSESTPVIKSMPNGPKKFTKIILQDSGERNLIFRAKEAPSEVIVTNDLAQKIEEAAPKGLKLIKEKTRF